MRQPRDPFSYSTASSRPCRWRDFGVALSLANLCFLDVWARCLPVALGNDIFYVQTLPPHAYYGALVANVAVLGFVLWATDCFLRRASWRPIRYLPGALFGLALVVAANALRFRLPVLSPDSLVKFVGAPGLLALFTVGGTAAVAVFGRWRRPLFEGARNLLLILLPFVGVTFGHAVWAAWGPVRASLEDPRPASVAAADRQPLMRVVLLVFDELDYAVTFEKRPAGLSLPHLDELQQEAVSASAAVPPGPETLLSIPSLFLGRSAADVRPTGAAQAEVQFRPGEEPIAWNDQSNLFSRIRQIGFRSAIRGWYLPYCRGFADSVASCAWEYYGRDYFDMTARESALDQWQDLFFSVPLTYRVFSGGERLRRDRIKQYLRLLDGARDVASDPDTAFTYLHFPVPHTPCIYDRARLAFRTDGRCDYLDNLVLADRTVGELRTAMEKSGVWETTAVVITGDHSWRRSPHKDARVPLLLRLPGQQAGIVYREPVNTVVLYDVILALLRGELKTPSGLVARLNGV